MVLCGVVFGRVVSKIVLCTFPVDVELFLLLSVSHPVETHIHGFGSALYYGVGEDTDSAFVVKLEWSGALGMTHFGECCSHGGGIFGVNEARACFGFLYGRHHSIDDFRF